MAQDISVLMGIGGGYAPMAPGIPFQRRTGFEGIPFFGGGLAGNILGQMVLGPEMAKMGMMPFGAGHDQNLYDLLRKMQYNDAQARAVREASSLDRESHLRTAQGVFALMNVPFGAEQRRFANTISSGLTAVAPYLVESDPDLLDKLSGSRGSAAVLARRMMESGRYRTDPVSGRMGLSPESASRQAMNIFRDLYADDRIGQMRGVSAGELGSLFQELQSRGMIDTAATQFGGSARFMETERAMRGMGPGALNALRQRTGVTSPMGSLTARDVDALRADPAMEDSLRAFDAERVKRSLKSYVDAIAAVRDILGDAGHPNAPMRQLVAALDALTAGSAGQVTPDKLAQMARQTYNLAKGSGIPIDNAMILQQHAAMAAQNAGLAPQFAIQIAQGSLAFGAAYRGQGHAAHVAWGAMTADQLQQLDANLNASALGSTMANQIGAAMRINQVANGFRPKSPGEAYLQAVRNGQNVPLMGEAEFTAMIAGSSGMPAAQVRSMVQDVHANREFTANDPMAMTAVRGPGMRQQAARFLGQQLLNTAGAGSSPLVELLKSQGMNGRDAVEAARQSLMGGAADVGLGMIDLPTQTLSDRGARNQAIGARILASMKGTPGETALMRLPEGERNRMLAVLAENFYAGSNTAIRSSPTYAVFDDVQNISRVMNSSTLAEAGRLTLEATLTSRMQELLGGANRGGMLRNIITAVQGVQPGDPQGAVQAIAQSLGGVSVDAIGRHMVGPVQEVSQKQRELQAMHARYVSASPSERAAMGPQIAKLEGELRQAADKVQSVFQSQGVFSESRTTAARVLGGVGRLEEGRLYALGVRTGAFEDVTADEIARTMASPGVLSQTDAAAILVAQMMEATDALEKGGGSAVEQDNLKKDIANLQASRPGITEADARAAVLQGKRAEIGRFGRSGSSTDAALIAARMAQGGPATEGQAKALILARRRKMGGETQSELAARIRALQGAPGKYTPEQISQRMAAFWGSAEGAQLRSDTGTLLGGVDDLAMQFIVSGDIDKASGDVLGRHASMMDARNEIAMLAVRYAGGDIARLRAYDLNTSDPAVHAQVDAAFNRLTDSVRGIAEPVSGTGPDHTPTSDAIRKRIRDTYQTAPRTLANDLYQAYGFLNDANRKSLDAPTRIFATAEGRAFAGYALETQRTLQKASQSQEGIAAAQANVTKLEASGASAAEIAAAKAHLSSLRNGGLGAIDAIVQDYNKASAPGADQASRIQALRKQYGLSDDAAFEKLQSAVRFQKQTGLDKYGRKGQTEQEFLDIFHLQGVPSVAGGQAKAQQMTIAGTLKLDFDARQGTFAPDARGNVAPQP